VLVFIVVGFALDDEPETGGHEAPGAAYLVLTLPVSSHFTGWMTLFLSPFGLPWRFEKASIMISMEPFDCSCEVCKYPTVKLACASLAHFHPVVIEGVTNVQEHSLAGRRVGHLGFETTILLRLLLPSHRIAIVGRSAHGFQRLIQDKLVIRATRCVKSRKSSSPARRLGRCCSKYRHTSSCRS
jgi:hypothetical protein